MQPPYIVHSVWGGCVSWVRVCGIAAQLPLTRAAEAARCAALNLAVGALCGGADDGIVGGQRAHAAECVGDGADADAANLAEETLVAGDALGILQ